MVGCGCNNQGGGGYNCQCKKCNQKGGGITWETLFDGIMKLPSTTNTMSPVIPSEIISTQKGGRRKTRKTRRTRRVKKSRKYRR